MVESGLGGRFWFRAATAGKDARNMAFKERIGMTQHHGEKKDVSGYPSLPRFRGMYGEKKDVSDYSAFGCRSYVYKDKQRREKGKDTPIAKEAVYVGL